MANSPVEDARPGRTALVLCGGGITGAVYELGALLALDDFFAGGFDVGQFDIYVGTSAGAFMATLMAAGLRPRALARAVMEGQSAFLPMTRHDIFRFDGRELLRQALDFVRILYASLARAARRRELSWFELANDLEDALPSGIYSLRHYRNWIERTFRQHGVPIRFQDFRRELYITSNDLDSGHRVVFGAEGFRDVPIPDAICASSAIPLFFEPFRIGDRDYIDGAAGKAGHLDVALKRGAELVVCINPRVPIRNEPGSELPSAILGKQRLRDKGLLTVYEQAQRISVRTKLHAGLRRYRHEFPRAQILLLEPREEEADMHLANPMNFAVRQRILRYGYDSAARQLLEREAEFVAACARHRIATAVDKLRTRPWDLVA